MIESNPKDEFPMSRGAIWLMCLILTPICGAVLYYAWRKNNPKAANYANRVSWISWLLWVGVYVAYRFSSR